MTDVFAMVQSLGSIIGDAAAPYALVSTPDRNIGGIYPDVTIEEVARDEMFITQHPVDIGCPVSDHAFIQPWSVEIKYGFSDSSAQAEGYSKAIYQNFQTLQQSAKPFTVTTGKRSYSSMLVSLITQRTNAQSENSLDIAILCRYVNITDSQTSSSGGPSNGGSAVDDKGQSLDASQSPGSGGTINVNTLNSTPNYAGTGFITPAPNSGVAGIYSIGAVQQ